MSTPLVVTHTQERMRLPKLRTVMVASLVGTVLVYIVLQVLIIQELVPPLAIITALTLVVAGVCATRWRWAPHLAVLWCVLSLIPGLEHYRYDLAHPAEISTFITTVLRNGSLPVVLGIQMLAGPFSQRLGLAAALAAAVPWAVVNALEMLAGYWLWKSRKRGGVLALVLLPAGMIFWIGYALPIMIMIGPLRVLLLAWGWKSLS